MSNLFLKQKTVEFRELLRTKTDYQLVNTFNRETSHYGWVGIRASYLQALRDVFKEREIDFSQLFDNGFVLK